MTVCLAAKHLEIERTKNGASFQLRVPFLEVFFGQTLAVVGASGCGKSTLLDMLALILRPQRASVFAMHAGQRNMDLLHASPSTLADIRGQHIGYVLQSGGLLSFLSVEENILLPGRLCHIPEEELHTRAHLLAEILGIEGQMRKKPQHLSGGQRQRVAIARALIHRPELVLADEPTAAVDQSSAEDICAIFTRVVRKLGAALVIVSHDRPLMDRIADELITFRVTKVDENHVCSEVLGGRRL